MMSALPRRTLIAWTAGLLSGGAATAINTSGDSVGDALDLSDFLAGGFAATFHEPLSFTPGKVRVQPPRPTLSKE